MTRFPHVSQRHRRAGAASTVTTVLLLVAARASAQSSPPPSGTVPFLVVARDNERIPVSIHALDGASSASPDGDIECTMPCELNVAPGRYEVVYSDSDLREHRETFTVSGPRVRALLEVRAHSDRAVLSDGVGFLAFGIVLTVGGLILSVAGGSSQASANQQAQSQTMVCSAMGTLNSACCGGTGYTGTSMPVTACSPTDYSADIAIGVGLIGAGIVGVIVGAVLIASSGHRHSREDRTATLRHVLETVAVEATPVQGGGVLSATLRF